MIAINVVRQKSANWKTEKEKEMIEENNIQRVSLIVVALESKSPSILFAMTTAEKPKKQNLWYHRGENFILA